MVFDCIVTAVISAYIFKKLSKLVNFCVAILVLKIKENIQLFWHSVLYYFKKGKYATDAHKKCVQCMEKVLGTIECVNSGL